MCLYAQGYSMSDYLVRRSDRRTFLNFVGHGMQYGWDRPCASFYGHRTVEELEEAWLQHLRDYARAVRPRPCRSPATQVGRRARRRAGRSSG